MPEDLRREALVHRPRGGDADGPRRQHGREGDQGVGDARGGSVLEREVGDEAYARRELLAVERRRADHQHRRAEVRLDAVEQRPAAPGDHAHLDPRVVQAAHQLVEVVLGATDVQVVRGDEHAPPRRDRRAQHRDVLLQACVADPLPLGRGRGPGGGARPATVRDGERGAAAVRRRDDRVDGDLRDPVGHVDVRREAAREALGAGLVAGARQARARG